MLLVARSKWVNNLYFARGDSLGKKRLPGGCGPGGTLNPTLASTGPHTGEGRRMPAPFSHAHPHHSFWTPGAGRTPDEAKGAMVCSPPPACLSLCLLFPFAELGMGTGTRKAPVRWASFLGDPFTGKRWTLKLGGGSAQDLAGLLLPPPLTGQEGRARGSWPPMGRWGTHKPAGVCLATVRDLGFRCFPCSFGDRSEGPQRWERGRIPSTHGSRGCRVGPPTSPRHKPRPQTPPVLGNLKDQYRICHVQLFCEKKPEVSHNSTPH